MHIHKNCERQDKTNRCSSLLFLNPSWLTQILSIPFLKVILISPPKVCRAHTKVMPANAGIFKLKQPWNGFYSSLTQSRQWASERKTRCCRWSRCESQLSWACASYRDWALWAAVVRWWRRYMSWRLLQWDRAWENSGACSASLSNRKNK